jgi:hypothetical protein
MKLNESPFLFGKIVSKSAFTNRLEEVQRLKLNLVSGINTSIISPRRWGKSSLVEKVAVEIGVDKKYKIVIIDLFTVNTKEEFLELFAREVIKASSTKWQEWVTQTKKVFKQLIPKIQLNADIHSEFSIAFDVRELEKYPNEVLNLPETLAKENDCKFIICLDEFQNLARLKDFLPFERKLRAVWQRQQATTYCLYGSKRHMMTDIFNNPSKPFYRFGDLMLLQKINTSDWIKFIKNGFRKTGKSIDKKTAKLIATTMQDHSWYVQQLSHYTWNYTRNNSSTSEVKAALTELINANSPLYQREIELFSRTQLNLLKAIASGEKKLTSTRVMQNFNLGTPNNVRKNKKNLIENDIIDNSVGFEFLDPAFEIWFRINFFNKKLEEYFDDYQN